MEIKKDHGASSWHCGPQHFAEEGVVALLQFTLDDVGLCDWLLDIQSNRFVHLGGVRKYRS